MNTRKYALYGGLFGLFFPLGGTLLQAVFESAALGFGARLARVQAMPLMWIIDTAPLFLGLFASLAGRRQDQLIASEEAKRATFTKTSAELFAAAKDLLSTVSSFSSLTTETAASVRETTATMSQLAQTAARSALTAETVVGLAEASQRCSVDGLRAVETSTAELAGLAEKVRQLSSGVEGLNDRMRDIFEIASVMNYASDRSERLAASAVAEMERYPAARAFAGIVAEMRRQAEEAKRSALQVKGILGEVHKAMLVAMTEAADGVVRAEEGALVATATGETIRKLSTALRDSSQAAKDIAMVAQQQDHGIDQVLKAMNEIFLATEETMAGTRRVADDARALNDLANRLDRSVRGAA
jgi:methyl-accepting chemotaxis protein